MAVSHVLAAMGVDTGTALATIRLSVGRFTTEDEVDRAADEILSAAGLPQGPQRILVL